MSTPKPLVDEYGSRSIRAQIRHILLEVWDPIGIKDKPNAQDEYDSYVGRLYELFVNGAPDSDLIEHLYWSAHDLISFNAARRSDMESTVEAIRKIPLGLAK